jgi:hypothetical protein
MNNKNILAFVHITKAAGTSLTNLLRYNYPITHCDVKPLSKDSSRVFSSRDMKKIMKINPWVKSISGHSITPSSDLRKAYPNIRYITLMRDPIERYISAYLYFVDVRGYEGDITNYSASGYQWNFQVKKIAGVEDVQAAKQIVDKELLLVGLVEEFAGFLLLLKKKLSDDEFKLHSFHENKGKKNHMRRKVLDNLDQYLPVIKERNKLDIELYNYVKEKWKQEKINYGPSYSKDLERMKQLSWDSHSFSRNINFLYRNLYFKPLIAYLRIISDRKVRGGY